MSEYQKDAYDIFSSLDYEAGRLEKLREEHARAVARHAEELAAQEQRLREAEAAAVAVMEFNQVARCVRGDTVYCLQQVPYTDLKRVEVRTKAILPDVWTLKMPEASDEAVPAVGEAVTA